jgi:hypothetical protein
MVPALMAARHAGPDSASASGPCRLYRQPPADVVMRPRTPSYTRPISLASAENGASYAAGSARTTTSTGGITGPRTLALSAFALAVAGASAFASAAALASAFGRPSPRASALGRSAGSSRVRTSSRRRRLRRFRSTDECPYLGTTKPTRGCGHADSIARTSRYSTRIRVPDRRTATRSAALVSRSLRGSPLGAGILAGQTDSQPLAAFLPPPAQHFASPPGRHPSAESMLLDTALIAGAICGLAHGAFYSECQSMGGAKPGKL